jgi:nicotinamidase-related amidase
MLMTISLPMPPHFDPDKVGEVWRVPYQERFEQALKWAKRHALQPAAGDRFRISLVLVDVQNTFCVPGFELFVGGRSGSGAVRDNQRLCRFIYRNLHQLTEISPTMDTHQAMQIFHSLFFSNEKGEHPSPFTLITLEDIDRGRWKVNPLLVQSLRVDREYADEYVKHYVNTLRTGEKYDLTIWPYHAMLGGIGHALVSAVEEAIFFHTVARYSQPDFQIKGNNPLTEHYSVIGPEVLEDARGRPIHRKNQKFVDKLAAFDMIIIAGQAKSHCVAWTVDDLLKDLSMGDQAMAKKVYLLEDCTSSVVIEGGVDYTEEGDAAFKKFAAASMHIVRSEDPMEEWPDVILPFSV